MDAILFLIFALIAVGCGTLGATGPDSTSISYDDKEIAKSNPGTPFLNPQGEVSSVLMANPTGALEFASADDIRRFLQVAASIAVSV